MNKTLSRAQTSHGCNSFKQRWCLQETEREITKASSGRITAACLNWNKSFILVFTTISVRGCSKGSKLTPHPSSLRAKQSTLTSHQFIAGPQRKTATICKPTTFLLGKETAKVLHPTHPITTLQLTFLYKSRTSSSWNIKNAGLWRIKES